MVNFLPDLMRVNYLYLRAITLTYNTFLRQRLACLREKCNRFLFYEMAAALTIDAGDKVTMPGLA
jgi:hypothetical protein